MRSVGSGVHQPFMSRGERDDPDEAQFPTPIVFDPKAITRASWELKPNKLTAEAPLIAFSQHSDALLVPGPRSTGCSRMMAERAKKWIKGIRMLQLVLRIVEMVAGLGILTSMVLLSYLPPLAACIMRITPGVVVILCVCFIHHLSRAADGRSPGSAAAYHTFTGITDLAVLPLYGYSIMNMHGLKGSKTTLLSNQALAETISIAVSYALMGAAGLHLVSLVISVYLGVMFRRIAEMPPDMSTLEAHHHLTARTRTKAAQKGNNKSCVTTAIALDSFDGDVDLKHVPCVSAHEKKDMHTRMSSDPNFDLGTPSLRSSPPKPKTTHRVSGPPLPPPHRFQHPRPLGYAAAETLSPPFLRPDSHSCALVSTGSVPSYRASFECVPVNVQPARAAKFIKACYGSDSLVGRTQRALNAQEVHERAIMTRKKQSDGGHTLAAVQQQYEPLSKGYNRVYRDDEPCTDDEDDDDDDNAKGFPWLATGRTSCATGSDVDQDDSDRDSCPANHPHPLHSHITRQNYQWASDKQWQPRPRDSSIQPETDFSSKLHGDLSAQTSGGGTRQMSSGNDFFNEGFALSVGGKTGRRHVSGRAAEEGRAVW